MVHRVCRTHFPRRILSSVACAAHRSLKMRMETSGLANWRLSVMVGGGVTCMREYGGRLLEGVK